MICCVAAAFIVAWIRRLLGLVMPRMRRSAAVPFPAVTRVLPPGGPAPSPQTVAAAPTTAPPSRGVSARALHYAAFAVFGYVAVVALLLLLGGASSRPSAAIGWPARTSVLLTLCGLLVLLARTRASAPDLRWADALMGAGGSWFLVGLVDMHAFGLYVIAHGDLVWDVLFHGAGTTALAVGWALRALGTPRSAERRATAADPPRMPIRLAHNRRFT